MRDRLLDITFDLASFVLRLPRQSLVRLPLSRSTTATVTAGYHRCTILMTALPALMPTLLLLCRVVAKKKLRQPTRPCQCIGAGAAESQSASQPACHPRCEERCLVHNVVVRGAFLRSISPIRATRYTADWMDG